MEIIIDYTISQRDLSQMDDNELSRLLMYSDRDRKNLEIAETIYWWCIEEINKRIEEENHNGN